MEKDYQIKIPEKRKRQARSLVSEAKSLIAEFDALDRANAFKLKGRSRNSFAFELGVIESSATKLLAEYEKVYDLYKCDFEHLKPPADPRGKTKKYVSKETYLMFAIGRYMYQRLNFYIFKLQRVQALAGYQKKLMKGEVGRFGKEKTAAEIERDEVWKAEYNAEICSAIEREVTVYVSKTSEKKAAQGRISAGCGSEKDREIVFNYNSWKSAQRIVWTPTFARAVKTIINLTSKNGRFWASQNTFAGMAYISRKTANEVIAKLRETGVFRTVYQGGITEDGQRISGKYTVIWHELRNVLGIPSCTFYGTPEQPHRDYKPFYHKHVAEKKRQRTSYTISILKQSKGMYRPGVVRGGKMPRRTDIYHYRYDIESRRTVVLRETPHNKWSFEGILVGFRVIKSQEKGDKVTLSNKRKSSQILQHNRTLKQPDKHLRTDRPAPLTKPNFRQRKEVGSDLSRKRLDFLVQDALFYLNTG